MLTWEAWFTLAVVVIVLVALVRDVVAPAAAMVGGMVAVLVAGIVTPEEAFAGFANPAPITVAALFVLARAVEKTGALTPVVRMTLGATVGMRRSLARLVFPTISRLGLPQQHTDRRHAVAPGGEVGRGAGPVAFART